MKGDASNQCITPGSIEVLAQIAGVTRINEEAKKALAPDVDYRLREIIQDAQKFARHGRRTKVTTVSNFIHISKPCPFPPSATLPVYSRSLRDQCLLLSLYCVMPCKHAIISMQSCKQLCQSIVIPVGGHQQCSTPPEL